MARNKTVAKPGKSRVSYGPSNPTHWHGGSVVSWIALGITLVANTVWMGYVYGSVASRLHHLESITTKQESQLSQLGSLREDIAVAKVQLVTISSTLTEIKAVLGPAQGRSR